MDIYDTARMMREAVENICESAAGAMNENPHGITPCPFTLLRLAYVELDKLRTYVIDEQDDATRNIVGQYNRAKAHYNATVTTSFIVNN